MCFALPIKVPSLGSKIHRENCMNLTFRGPCIVIYSYNKSQRDALFLKFILIKNFTCFGQLYCPSIIRSLDTIFTAIGICRSSYVDCLLARSLVDLLLCIQC
jgi:hypothetical protein